MLVGSATTSMVNRVAVLRSPKALVVAGGGRPYSAPEIARQLEMALLADLPWDPATAAVLSDGAVPPRKLTNRPLWRALRGLALQLGGRPGVRGRRTTRGRGVIS